VKEVGLEDNFFDLGGDSLLGMRLMVALRDKLAIEVPLRHLFNTETLREFCAILEVGERQACCLEQIARSLGEIECVPGDEVPAPLGTPLSNAAR
jgi:acyl carrier protein